MPVRLVNNTLLVAMLTPDQPVAIKSIELLTGLKVQPAAAPKNALSAALEKYYGNGNDAAAIIKNSGKKPIAPPSVKAPKEQEKNSFNISIIYSG